MCEISGRLRPARACRRTPAARLPYPCLHAPSALAQSGTIAEQSAISNQRSAGSPKWKTDGQIDYRRLLTVAIDCWLIADR
ncbi:MAG TPA: hypothetical protein VGB73_03740 [Pyrinomonadaceae bacterium]